MAVITNTTLSTDLARALDQEVVENFDQSYNSLAEILGVVAPEPVAAGTALYSRKITGTLDATSYTEGDEVPVSKYVTTDTPIGAVTLTPRRRRTTAQAIQKAGVEAAILRTDAKMTNDVRSAIFADFVTALAAGTTTATGTTLQQALANAGAALANAMETNSDGAPTDVIHLVNRLDAASYLGTQPITTQTVFGLTYLESFLGVERVILTNKVKSGTLYVVPSENLHVYAPDFGALAQAGLAYTTSDAGLIGVAHSAAYDHASVDTNIMSGLVIAPEFVDYIVKGTIAPAA